MKNKEYNDSFFNAVKNFDIAFSQNDFYTKYARYKYKNEMMFYYNFKNSKFSIISLCNQKKFNQKLYDLIIAKLKKKLQNYSSKKSFPILHVIICEKNIQDVKHDLDKKITYLTTNQASLKKEVKNLIPEIDFDAEIKMNEYIETRDNLKNNNSNPANSFLFSKNKTYQKLSILRTKARLSNLPIVLSIIAFCVILPVFVTIFWSSNSANLNFSSNSFLMVFGALNRDLIIGLNQWWRIFTYPLIGSGLISILINGFIFFYVCRYIEVLLGLKKTLILLCAYPFLGLLFVLISQTVVISGIIFIFALFVGATLTTIYKRNDYVAKFAKQSAFMGIFYLLLCFFLIYTLSQTFFIFVTFIIGAIFGLLFNHNYQKKDLYFYIPIALIALFFTLIVVMICLIKFKPVVPSYNPDVVNSLGKYVGWKFLSSETLSNFIKNYYFYNANNFLLLS